MTVVNDFIDQNSVEYIVQRFDQTIHIQDATEQGLVKLFANTFDCFGFQTPEQSTEYAKNLRISSDKIGWVIEEADGSSRRVSDAGDLAYYLTDRIIHNLVKPMTTGHCIHAACVAKGDQAIVMPAQSGDGKSSLTCWLLANGYEYVTDELVIFDANNFNENTVNQSTEKKEGEENQIKLRAIPRPVQIKKQGIDVIESLLSLNDEQNCISGKVASSYSPSAFGAQLSELDCFNTALVLFPKYQQGASYSFIQTSKAQAAANLMASHVNARCLEAHGFKYISELSRKTTSYSLEYGGYQFLEKSFLNDLAVLGL